MSCKFEELCLNVGGDECDVCHFNPEACTQGLFEWNGEGQEPSEQELDNEIQN